MGEKSCWPRRLCDAGAKGQEEEKAEQRRFFSGEWESQEGRRPGEKEGRREMKRTAEEAAAQQAGHRQVAPPGSSGLSHSGTKTEAGLPGPQDAGPRHTHPIPPLASAG